MSVFGLGDDVTTSVKVKDNKSTTKLQDKKTKKVVAKDDQAAEAQAILAKMQAKEDGGECAFC